MTRPRLLAVRALGLGDFLTGVPALRALRRALPDHELWLAAPEVLAPLVELADCVDHLLPTGELQPVSWPGPPPDVAVDLHGNGPATKDLLLHLHPRRLIAFAGPCSTGWHPGPRWQRDEHERSRWCRLLAEELGAYGAPDDVRITAPSGVPPAPGAIVLHPGAASGSRRWPVERWAKVARDLDGRGCPVVVTGAADEEALVLQVCTAAELTSQQALIGGRLGQLAAIVAGARLVVCGDTGVAHLASALGRPSVLLFGPTPPAWWGPPPGPHRVLWHGAAAGDPHADEPDPALLAISAAEVLRAVSDQLALDLHHPSQAVRQ